MVMVPKAILVTGFLNTNLPLELLEKVNHLFAARDPI
jgi:hypothetical protein